MACDGGMGKRSSPICCGPGSNKSAYAFQNIYRSLQHSLDLHGAVLLKVEVHLEGVAEHVRLVSGALLQALVQSAVVAVVR